jgi:hypothetical protein
MKWAGADDMTLLEYIILDKIKIKFCNHKMKMFNDIIDFIVV